jgi:hypothetical protein
MKRTWNTYARWKFRDFNEFPHVLEERLRQSEKYGDEYMSQFSSHWLATCAKFASFIMSTFLVSLFLLSLFNGATLFNLEISSGRSVFWYIGIFSTLLLISRSMEIQKNIFSPKKKMEKLAKMIQYIPEDWIENASSENVKTEISRLFEYRFTILFKELIGMLLNPILMWFNLDKNIEKIVDFMRNSTLKHPDIGHVCKFGVFEGLQDQLVSSAQLVFEDVGKKVVNLRVNNDVNQKKLEASVRNFHEQFPRQDSEQEDLQTKPHIMESILFDIPHDFESKDVIVEKSPLEDASQQNFQTNCDAEEQLDLQNESTADGSGITSNIGAFSFNPLALNPVKKI